MMPPELLGLVLFICTKTILCLKWISGLILLYLCLSRVPVSSECLRHYPSALNARTCLSIVHVKYKIVERDIVIENH